VQNRLLLAALYLLRPFRLMARFLRVFVWQRERL
jgi:hypothetical protein